MKAQTADDPAPEATVEAEHDRARVATRASADYVLRSMQLLGEMVSGEFLTGLIYLSPERPNFVDMQAMTDTPLAQLPDSSLRPSREVLETIMATI